LCIAGFTTDDPYNHPTIFSKNLDPKDALNVGAGGHKRKKRLRSKERSKN